MRRFTTLIAAVAIVLSLTAAPASAITNGELDGDGHPYVGLMVFQLADGRFRCSGALVTSTKFLTAGHCTFGVIGKVQIWFLADVETNRCKLTGADLTPENCAAATPNWNGFPFFGQATGTAFAHPQFDPDAFFLHDLGLVVLDKPFKTKTVGALPSLGQNRAYSDANPGKSAVYTAVGYGLQEINPAHVEQQRVRMFANPYRIQIDDGIVGDFSMLLSNNHSSGGTCFGDSGGPNFIGSSNVIGAVTSFGLNGNCAGTGGVYRVDQPDDLNWLATFGLN